MQQLTASQSSPEIPVNENFATLAFASVYGQSQATSAGLTWGYYGGRWGGFSVADGVLALTDSATNYVVVALSTGVISVSSAATNWNNTAAYGHVYKLITAGGFVTTLEDHRSGPGGVFGALGGAAGSGGSELRGLTFTSDSATADSDPGNGKFRWNNTTQASATALYFDAQTADGASLVTLFAGLGTNGYLYLQENDDPTKWQKWKWTAVTAGASNTYYKLAVTLQASSTNPIAPGVIVYCDLDVTGSAATGTVTSVGIVAPAKGITVSGGPVTSNGNITLALADSLAALQALTGTGFVKRTGTDQFVLSDAGTAFGYNVGMTAGTIPVFGAGGSLTVPGALTLQAGSVTKDSTGQYLFATDSGVAYYYTGTGGLKVNNANNSATLITVSNAGAVAVSGTLSAASLSGNDLYVTGATAPMLNYGGSAGLTRRGAGILSLGNGTRDDASGTLLLQNLTATGAVLASNFDTDPAMAANSDARVPTQKALVSFIQSMLDGRSWKQAVRAATTASGTLATAFAAGQVLDGVTLATGDRILLKDQATASQNGIYVVAATGAPTRSTDADSGPELVNATLEVSEGTTNADKQFTCSTNAPITVGTTAIVFVLTSSASSGYTADEVGIHLSGTTFSIKAGGVNLATDVSGVLPVSHLATGTPDGTKFVRDDGTLAAPSGLSHFTEAVNNVSPNDSVPVHSLTPSSTGSDVDLAIVTIGGGALLRNVPDGTSSGGNKRGYFATDLQVTLDNFSAVASGPWSVIGGGRGNRASSQFGAILGGHGGSTRDTYAAQAHGTIGNWLSSNPGASQHRRVVLTSSMTDATPAPLSALGGSSATSTVENITLEEDNTAFAFSAFIHAQTSVSNTSDCGVWRVSGAARRKVGASTTALLGTPVVESIVTPAGALSVSVAVDVNGFLQFIGTGLASEETYFCAVVDLNEMELPP